MADKPALTSRLDFARQIAVDAGSLAKARFGSSLSIQTKASPLDLVTEADLAVEEFVRAELRRVFPDDRVIAEEGAPDEGTTGLAWAVDPIDGTANYVLGLPHWCVSIGVLDNDRSVAGAIFDPMSDDLYWSAAGEGAWRGDRPISRPRRPLELSTWAIGLAEDIDVSRRNDWEQLIRPRVGRVRAMGSLCLDFAWCAAGLVDACFYECGLRPWDYAACETLCIEAGLRSIRVEATASRSAAMLAYPLEWEAELAPLLREAAL